MKWVASALLLVGLACIASARAQQLLGAGSLLDVDENDLSTDTANVLSTTRDALSPQDQDLLQEMLQESEGIELVDQNGDSVEGEVEAEADALASAAEESEEESDEAEAEGDHYVVANEIPGTAHSVSIAENEDEAESDEVVEAEDIDEEADEADEAEDLTDTSDLDLSLIQIDAQEQSEAESEDESEDEDEQEDETEEDSEEESEAASEEPALVETSSAGASILSVPEAEAHHFLIQVQEPAMAFLQVVEELGVEESEDESEGEVSDSADNVELGDGEAETSDSADNDSALGEGWGEELSTTDPYALIQHDELLYADSDSSSPLVEAPVNAVTSTSETAAQIHAELEEAANLQASTEVSVQASASASDAAEAEADTDTSEEMEVDAYGEGAWQDAMADAKLEKRDSETGRA